MKRLIRKISFKTDFDKSTLLPEEELQKNGGNMHETKK
jgi:hypothetical protein